MKYCQKCGKEIMDEAVVCPNCGCSVATKEVQKTNGEDKVQGGLIAASILLPIVGVILWPVKHKETPKAAMTYGLTGIISWVLWFILMSAMMGM